MNVSIAEFNEIGIPKGVILVELWPIMMGKLKLHTINNDKKMIQKKNMVLTYKIMKIIWVLFLTIALW